MEDFSILGDRILLSKATFTRFTSAAGSGFSTASEFATVTSDTAAATSSALRYDELVLIQNSDENSIEVGGDRCAGANWNRGDRACGLSV